MSDYQGAYPYLKMAKEFDRPYEQILAFNDWMQGKAEQERNREALEEFFRWARVNAKQHGEIAVRCTKAHQHFELQKRGRMDMEGNTVS